MSKGVLGAVLAAAIGATGCTIDPARIQKSFAVLVGDPCVSIGGNTMPRWEVERNVRGGHDGLRHAFVNNNGKKEFNLPVVNGSSNIVAIANNNGNARMDVEMAIESATYCYGAKLGGANQWGQTGYSQAPKQYRAPRR
ncbi:MAG: hypothetical protein JNK24_07245 [Alphaproteobacteria bacterium]|nr:hypothetical protein [Alphaproteobacteria bacterium]